VTKQLLLGLPATGKTTFLAAFWHVVESEEVPESLNLVNLEGDREYLNRIRGQWLSFNEVKRTPSGPAETVSMRMLDQNRGIETELFISDLAGETFREQWVSRKWDGSFARTARDTEGLLLFVHPNEIIEPTTISDVLSLTAAQDMDDGGETVHKPNEPWHAENAATQVQLVDLLQFCVASLSRNQPLKVAVVVSAWDIVTEQIGEVVPAEWIKQRMPLLAQFLLSNQEDITAEVYGVSAQGGDLTRDRATLIQKEVASNRIIVQGGSKRSHDITRPLQWLMAGDD